MYIKALELKHYEKDVYLSVRVLELMDDGKLYKKVIWLKGLSWTFAVCSVCCRN